MTNSTDLKKPTDLDLHCLQRQGISGTSRTRVNVDLNEVRIKSIFLKKVFSLTMRLDILFRNVIKTRN